MNHALVRLDLQTLMDAQASSFHSPPCLCQIIRMWRLVETFCLPGSSRICYPVKLHDCRVADYPDPRVFVFQRLESRVIGRGIFDERGFVFDVGVALAQFLGAKRVERFRVATRSAPPAPIHHAARWQGLQHLWTPPWEQGKSPERTAHRLGADICPASDAAIRMPRARMGVREPGPNQSRVLEAHCCKLASWFRLSTLAPYSPSDRP
jgi:hypothetical protein